MTDDQLLLASAYVDDDLDPAERARAEADTEVMDEVTRLRAVRDALRDLDPPSAAGRDRAIAAALAAFDATPAPVAPPVPLQPRRAWWGGVAAAAAALVVVVAGAVALRDADDGDSGADSAAELAPAAAATEAAATIAASDEAQLDEASEETTAAADGTGGAAAATQAPGEATSAGTSSDAVLAAPALPVLQSGPDLDAFAERARTADGELPPPTCEQGGVYLGRAVYDEREVEVFDDLGTVTAVDAETCEPLLTVVR